MEYFKQDGISAYQAMVKAQELAFGPIAFQAARLLWKFGILEKVQKAEKEGLTLLQIQDQSSLSLYATKVLVEAGLGMGLLTLSRDRYFITKMAHILISDRMTQVNFNFTHDVCYQGMFNLEQALVTGKPAGLENFGDWPTIYEGLSQLTQQTQKSWFDFDHFYSDEAFISALPHVFAQKPKSILDVGGNTGKWALTCTQYDPDVKVTIADLPAQIKLAQQGILTDRISFFGVDILNPESILPSHHDVIWMSQFLDCFSTDQIISILIKTRKSMDETSKLFILETYWDRQRNPTAAYCLQQTSLYFTALANGNSQMYHSRDLRDCLFEAGFTIEKEWDQVGSFHTLTLAKNTGILI